MKKRMQLGTLFIAVSFLICAPASAAEQDRNPGHKHFADQHKAAESAAERAEDRERNLRKKHNPDQQKAAGPSEEQKRELRDKHNTDQHHNVSDGNWHTFYMDPGQTNIYVTCNGVAPNLQNKFEVNCKTKAVWVSCPSQDVGNVSYAFCTCTSLASEQHSGEYQVLYCPGGG